MADDLAAHARSAQAAIASNNVALAVQELRAILEIDPNNVNAIANIGMIEFLQGEYENASRQFESALSRLPSLWSAQAFLGMCRIRLGMAEGGRKLIEASLPHVSDRPLHVQAGLELVKSYSESGEMEKAENVIGSLQDFDPKNPEVLYATYRIHSEMASAALANLTSLDSDSPWVHEVLGQNFMTQEQYVAAAAEFRKALECSPRLAGLRYQLGQALLLQGRTEENRSLAEEEFLAELAINPNDAGSLFKLGEIGIERSDFTKAKAFLNRALKSRPQFAEAHSALAKVLEHEGDLAGAIAHLETAERLAPNAKLTHYRLAQLYRAQNRLADSERELDLFRRLSAGNAQRN